MLFRLSRRQVPFVVRRKDTVLSRIKLKLVKIKAFLFTLLGIPKPLTQYQRALKAFGPTVPVRILVDNAIPPFTVLDLSAAQISNWRRSIQIKDSKRWQETRLRAIAHCQSALPQPAQRHLNGRTLASLRSQPKQRN